MLGLIGRGRWGCVYADTLAAMKIPFWQAGADWESMPTPDGIIIASNPASHYSIASDCMSKGIPVLIEKPVCMNAMHARNLLRLAQESEAIALVGHTRLYSPAWHDFKREVGKVKSVSASAGGCEREPWWDWGPHLVAMCLDIGFEPERAKFSVGREKSPLSFVANGKRFTDVPTDPMPLNCLVQAFCDAIDRDVPNLSDLALAVQVVEFLDGAH